MGSLFLNSEDTMTKFIFLLTSFIVTVSTSNLPGKRPYYPLNKSNAISAKLTCYSGPNQQGDAVILTNYAPVLENYDFNNRAASCCFEGIWLLYDGENYNTGDPNLSSFNGWGEGKCLDFDSRFSQKASSARYTGAPDGYKYSVLNMYQYDNYAGNEQYFYNDSPTVNIDNLGYSAVVSGCDAWTIYEYDNYQGRSVCLFPSDQINCYPSFFPGNGLGQL